MNATTEQPEAPPITVRVYPAFFLIEDAGDNSADECDEIVTNLALNVTKRMREQAYDHLRRASRILAPTPADIPFFALRLCEASPTTDLEWDGDVDNLPGTLEGLTIDAGSDRSATALVHRLVEQDGDKPAPVRLASILTTATGWLHQRMALHPHASTEPAHAPEQALDGAQLLLHAFARADGRHPHWSDLRAAFHAARAQYPGLFEELEAGYAAARTHVDYEG